MNSSVPLILAAVVFGVGGQLTLKIGMTQVGRIGTDVLMQPLQLLVRVLTTPMVVGGLALYVVGAAVWLAVLSRVPLSLAYPVLALSYVFTPLLAWMILGENLTSLRWLGVGTIFLGVLLVARS
jgi:drug/metabolite transporter (DMT)-like permease